MRIPLSLLLIVLPILAAEAQDDLSDESAEPRRYTIEMIIFRYAQEVSTGNEIFPAEKPPFRDSAMNGDSLFIEDPQRDEISMPERVFRDIEFTMLGRDQYTMGDVLSRLRRLDVYEPLMHFGWTQATWPDEETLPIELGQFGRAPAGLSGTLRLYLSRYLHLVVDLELDAPGQPGGSGRRSDALPDYGDYRSVDESRSQNDAYETAMLPVRYRIEENRILRSGELRYFDHPKFGVLAKVTRVEDLPDDPTDLADSELLGYPAE